MPFVWSQIPFPTSCFLFQPRMLYLCSLCKGSKVVGGSRSQDTRSLEFHPRSRDPHKYCHTCLSKVAVWEFLYIGRAHFSQGESATANNDCCPPPQCSLPQCYFQCCCFCYMFFVALDHPPEEQGHNCILLPSALKTQNDFLFVARCLDDVWPIAVCPVVLFSC